MAKRKLMPSKEFKARMAKIVNPKHKGALHRALGVPEGEKIPESKLEAALHSKNAHIKHMAQAAKNFS